MKFNGLLFYQFKKKEFLIIQCDNVMLAILLYLKMRIYK